MSDAAPRMCTGRMARVSGVILRRTSSGSSVSEASTSARMGMAPTASAAAAEAIQV